MSPPIITTPKGILLVAPAPNAKAMGTAPKAVARLVIKMGLSLEEAASKTA
jgi:hypothetical protein